MRQLKGKPRTEMLITRRENPAVPPMALTMLITAGGRRRRKRIVGTANHLLIIMGSTAPRLFLQTKHCEKAVEISVSFLSDQSLESASRQIFCLMKSAQSLGPDQSPT
jgi:hypothetical protein